MIGRMFTAVKNFFLALLWYALCICTLGVAYMVRKVYRKYKRSRIWKRYKDRKPYVLLSIRAKMSIVTEKRLRKWLETYTPYLNADDVLKLAKKRKNFEYINGAATIFIPVDEDVYHSMRSRGDHRHNNRVYTDSFHMEDEAWQNGEYYTEMYPPQINDLHLNEIEKLHKIMDEKSAYYGVVS